MPSLCKMPSPIFQSTHPVRGGTGDQKVEQIPMNISIHPPREGWDEQLQWFWGEESISIHPPREGWDVICGLYTGDFLYFNPPTP